MAESPADASHVVACPCCGAAAEGGAVYAADGRPLVWRSGPPTWGGNVKAAFGAGAFVGEVGVGPGVYLRGVRCRACRRLVLDDASAP